MTQRNFVTGGNELDPYASLPSEEMTYDADGRLYSYNNDETGMAFYAYNPDGTLQSYTEPNALSSFTRPSSLGTVGPISSPAVKYNYAYYQDGMLAQVATADNSTYREQYSYSPEGLLTTQAGSATWPQSGTTLQASYTGTQTFTAAGRLLSKNSSFSDPCPVGQTCRTAMETCLGCPVGESLSVAYDTYGRNETWSIRSGKYSGFSYDLENEPTTFTTTPVSGSSPVQWSMGYSARGELLSEQSPGKVLASFRSADGYLYSLTNVDSTDIKYGFDDSAPPTYTFDTRNSAALSRFIEFMASANTAYRYDLAGRRTEGRQYDALNRILKGIHAYAYGPGTIPYEIGGLTQHGPLGQTPTFATDTANNVLETRDVKFGMDANVLPYDSYTGVTVYNRDPFGFVAAQSNNTGTSAWTVSSLFAGCDASDAGDTGEAATSGFTGNKFNSCKSSGELYSYRTDGYFDGSLTFRGVRTYDADTQQWSTADVLGGTLPYNYGNNNPAMFDDPSGFSSMDSSGGDTCGAGNLWSPTGGCIDAAAYFGPPGISFGPDLPGAMGGLCGLFTMYTPGALNGTSVDAGPCSAMASQMAEATAPGEVGGDHWQSPTCRLDSGAGYDCENWDGKWNMRPHMPTGACVGGEALTWAKSAVIPSLRDLFNAGRGGFKVAVAGGNFLRGAWEAADFTGTVIWATGAGVIGGTKGAAVDCPVLN